MYARTSRRPLLLAFALSAAVHALALAWLPRIEIPRMGRDARFIKVTLAPPPAAPRPPRAAPRQIVAPPDEINDRAPEHARLESDRDNTVLQETVRPGVPHPAPERPAAPPQLAARPAPRPAPAREERAAKAAKGADRQRERTDAGHGLLLTDLFASTDELVRTAERAEGAHRASDAATEAARRRIALAVPPITPEWSLPGTRGTFDNLPDIQRGDVTLLNTKANVFAPFVRRVGERVFQHLVIRQRRLELLQILNARNPVQLKALLDRHGKLKSLRVESQSGNASMDDTLSDAVQTAAFDNNPPPGAANGDGEYEFVFEAQLRTYQPGPNGLPSRIESRLSVALM